MKRANLSVTFAKKKDFLKYRGKWRNTGYQHILPLPQCFKKFHSLTHSHTMTPFDAPGNQAF